MKSVRLNDTNRKVILNNIKNFIADQQEKSSLGKEFKMMEYNINSMLLKYREAILPPAEAEIVRKHTNSLVNLNFVRFEKDDKGVISIVEPNYPKHGDIAIKNIEITSKIRPILFEKLMAELSPELKKTFYNLTYYYKCESEVLLKKYRQILEQATTTRKLIMLHPVWKKFVEGVVAPEPEEIKVPAEITAFENTIS